MLFAFELLVAVWVGVFIGLATSAFLRAATD
jgi:hypothetical protein